MRRVVLLALFAAAAAAFVPGTASAQFFDPLSNGREFCATQSPNPDPRYVNPNPWSRLSLRTDPGGAGSVEARMHAMPPGADCIRGVGEGTTTTSDQCQPKCELEVMSVCEVHCGDHKHSAPFDWSVRLTATPSSAAWHLVGWTVAGSGAYCVPIRSVPTRDCVVQMDANAPRTATAVFRDEADKTPPAPAPVARAAALGGYTIEVTWDPSADERLLGYDVYVDGAPRSRVASAATRKVRLTAKCGTAYSVEVVAFDFSGNEARSAAAGVRTDACTTSGSSAGPRPNTVIHLKPARTTKLRAAFFHFGKRGDIAATRGFQCKLDKGRWARCSGVKGKRYRALKKGYHTFQVRAGNGAGWDPTPAKWRWRIR